MSSKLYDRLELEPKFTTKKITDANKQSAVCRRILYNIPICFRDVSVSSDFLFIDGFPFDMILCCMTRESFRAYLDHGIHHVKMKIDGKRVILGFDYARVEVSEEEDFHT